MHDERYERPRVEDRTTVTEPLNTINTSTGILKTPAWRSRPPGGEAAAPPAEPPGADGARPSSRQGWRTTTGDDGHDRGGGRRTREDCDAGWPLRATAGRGPDGGHRAAQHHQHQPRCCDHPGLALRCRGGRARGRGLRAAGGRGPDAGQRTAERADEQQPARPDTDVAADARAARPTTRPRRPL